MKRFVEGESRAQATLFPERLDDWIAEDNPVRAVDAFVDELDLAKLGFEGAEPATTGRPAYHPATLLKIYVYGYLNRIASSCRLERETQRVVGVPEVPDPQCVHDQRLSAPRPLGARSRHRAHAAAARSNA
jgi:transposase